MSISDGKRQQSSRLYFRRKDHKDVYGKFENMAEPRFHGGFYVKKDEQNLDGLLWRTMFPDKYFMFQTDNSYSVNPHGIVYPSEKILGGNSIYLNRSAYSDKARVGVTNNLGRISDGLYVSSKDERVVQWIEHDFGIGDTNAIVGMQGGVLVHATRDKWYFIEINEPEEPSGVCQIGEVTEFESTMSNVVAHPSSNIAWISGSDGSYKWYAFNSETKSLTQVGFSNMDLFYDTNTQCANGRWFHFHGKTVSGDTYYYITEINASGVVREAQLFTERKSNFGIVYANSRFYLYFNHRSQDGGGLILYTSTNMSSFSQVALPQQITIPNINGEDSITLDVAKANGDHIVYADDIYNQFKCYVNSERVSGNGELCYPQFFYTTHSNDYLVYIDNMTFQSSGSNFYATPTQCSEDEEDSVVDNQKMFKLYHHII